jgi:hypothetical protein
MKASEQYREPTRSRRNGKQLEWDELNMVAISAGQLHCLEWSGE